MDKRPRSHPRLLLLIIAAAILLRIAAAVFQGNQIVIMPGVYDQVSYHELALRVLQGEGFSFATGWWPATPPEQPTAHWSFLYVLYLSGVYLVFGPNPLAARLIQAVLAGFLQPLLTWRLANRLFGKRVGLVSAGLVSVYGYFIYYAGALVTETFYMIAVLWLIDIAIAASMKRSGTELHRLGPWVLLGIAAGVAALLRQVILVAVPLVLAWTLWHVTRRGLSRVAALKGVLATAAVLTALILPWTIRNYQAFGRFVLLNTNAGFVFFWGNHPIHGTEFIPILPNGKNGYASLIPRELRGLNEADMDRRLLQIGIRFVVDEPVRFAVLSLSRAREYFKFWPSRESELVSNLVRVFSFGLCFPLILWGLVAAFGRHRSAALRQEYQNHSAVRFVVGVATLYTLLHLVTWTLVRYRLPVDAMLLPFAGLGLVSLFHALTGFVASLRRIQPPTAFEETGEKLKR